VIDSTGRSVHTLAFVQQSNVNVEQQDAERPDIVMQYDAEHHLYVLQLSGTIDETA